MTRLLTLLAIVALVAPAATAQIGYYNGLGDDRDSEAPGVRVGLGVGPYVYDGPDILVGSAIFQDDVVATNLGITAEVTFPLSRQVYGRLLGGLLNIGADDDRPDLPSADANPFLTSQTILVEGDLLFYLTPPRRTGIAPYLFSGVSGLFATGDAVPGVNTSALAIPVGVGVDVGLSRNLSLFAEASYRFGLTSVGEEVGIAFATSTLTANAQPDDCAPDDKKCKEKKEECEMNPDLPGCPGVGDEGDSDFDTRFNSALILGGLRLGFGSAPTPVIPPPPPPPPPAPLPPPAPEPPPAPLVCDLVELNAIYFDYGSATVDRRARALLDENVELLLSNPACCVFIDGYTDTPEGDQFGLGLGGRRAQAVYDYYLGRGVGASRLQIRNRGVAAPNCDKEDPGPGCERNRRVESLPVDCERFRFLLDNPSYDPY